jgi:putative DNA primase/helicase
VFSSGDPFCGVDLDGCRDPETGEMEHWAKEIVEALSSYAEVSPSGRGVHIIAKGKAPTPFKRDRIEMYSIERFFTVTGQVLEDSA